MALTQIDIALRRFSVPVAVTLATEPMYAGFPHSLAEADLLRPASLEHTRPRRSVHRP